ncbi:hypothetical protein L227DRAFT_263534 [Lentinus tigrinus ALCF2SS1-6]|uniref:Uncharacterized protein n=1 Tax=Lentinus tigrinus ALCF2SS1-6 TaxID=1328759 RepID=A0A5C2SLZ9_9APHY|nr:hypothetical protein L227DRAFT_263534 [Lentinus tigrinus ALCF2SS1-6]
MCIRGSLLLDSTFSVGGLVAAVGDPVFPQRRGPASFRACAGHTVWEHPRLISLHNTADYDWCCVSVTASPANLHRRFGNVARMRRNSSAPTASALSATPTEEGAPAVSGSWPMAARWTRHEPRPPPDSRTWLRRVRVSASQRLSRPPLPPMRSQCYLRGHERHIRNLRFSDHAR